MNAIVLNLPLLVHDYWHKNLYVSFKNAD